MSMIHEIQLTFAVQTITEHMKQGRVVFDEDSNVGPSGHNEEN